MKDHPLIRVENLTIGFRHEREIHNAVTRSSFHVYSGKTLAIVGESGSGKSVSSLSLMRLLNKEKTVFSSGRFTIDPVSYTHLTLPTNREV